MRTANPALNEKTFASVRGLGAYGVGSPASEMTINGTVNKTAILLALVVATASYSWWRFSQGGIEAVIPWMLLGIFGGLVAALVTVFKKSWAPVTAPLYALLEGLALGGISAFFESLFPGIVIQAIGLTFGVAFALLAAYKSRLIPVTKNFRLGVVAATGGILVVYLASFVMSLFGASIPYIHGSGLIGIGFSLFVVVIAALNLVLDFDFIERGAQAGAPKLMEWFAAFGLVVTLVWLYVEILRLLSKIRSR